MLMTGLVLLAFTIYHIAHFTLGIVTTDQGTNYHELLDPKDRQDVFAMVVSSFKNPWITLTYLIAMVFLWLHLWHGVYSMFQSLGITNPSFQKLIRGLGPVVSTIVLIGNCSIPLSVYLGLIRMPRLEPPTIAPEEADHDSRNTRRPGHFGPTQKQWPGHDAGCPASRPARWPRNGTSTASR